MDDLDRADFRILGALQLDASRSVQDLAAEVGLSPNACWRRVKRLEEAGYIRGRVALLEPGRLGCGVTVFVMVRTGQHDQDWLETFARNVQRLPEVVEFHRMSGQVDYLLKVRVRDIADYDRVYKQLIRTAPLSDVTSSFAMEEIKATTAIPLPV